MKTQNRINNLKDKKNKIIKELSKSKENLKTKQRWDLITLILMILVAFFEYKISDNYVLKSLIPYIATYIIERTITACVYGLNYVNKNKSKRLRHDLHDVNCLMKSLEKSQEMENIKQYNEEIIKNNEKHETIPEIPVFDRHQKVKTIGSLKR